MAAFGEGFRPDFPGKCRIGSALKKLIIDCWAENPKDRPSFQTIFDLFAQGKVAFDGTDAKKIAALAKELMAKDQARKVMPPIVIRSPPKPPPARSKRTAPKTKKKKAQEPEESEATREKRRGSPTRAKRKRPRRLSFDSGSESYSPPQHRKRRLLIDEKLSIGFAESDGRHEIATAPSFVDKASAIHLKPPARPPSDSEYSDGESSDGLARPTHGRSHVDFSIFSDTAHPRFHSELSKLCVPDAPKFFRLVRRYLRHEKTTATVLNLFFQKCAELCLHADCAQEFCEQGIHELLVFDHPETFESQCKLLFPLFEHVPSFFEENFELAFGFVIQIDPERAIGLLSIYADSFHEIENPWPLVDLLISRRRGWLRTESGVQYVQLLVTLLKKQPLYRESRFGACRKVLVEFLSSKCPEVVEETYTAIAELYDDSFLLDFAVIQRHLDGSYRFKSLFAVLSKVRELPLVTDFVLSIVRAAKDSSEATRVVVNVALTPKGATLLVRHSKFLKWPLPTFLDTFKILFKMAKVVDVSDCPDIPILFALAAEERSSDLYDCFERFVTHDRISLNGDFFRALRETDFFGSFLDGFEELGDPAIIVKGLRTVEELAKVGFVSDFLRLRKPLKRFLRDGDALASAAVFALRELTTHRKMAAALVGKGFEDCLARFDGGSERRAARDILSDIRNAE
jgi:hypothetical protein